jgi:hypothetical protein
MKILGERLQRASDEGIARPGEFPGHSCSPQGVTM